MSDAVRASVLVRVPVAVAFQLFTARLGEWWRQGVRYRALSGGGSVVHLEAHLGGRLFETDEAGVRVVETGRVIAWDPPRRFVLEWRSVTFVPGEATEVEVTFEEKASGTLVTVTHRGWDHIRADHPVRHGQEVAAFLRGMALWWGDLLTSLRELAAAT